MDLFKNLESFELDKNKNKLFGLKCSIIWGNFKNGGTCPIIYLRKPKHMLQEDFDLLLDSIHIQIKILK